MSETNLNMNIDPELKKEAEAILFKMGVKPADVVKALYQIIKKNKSLPFDIKSLEMDETEYILQDKRLMQKLKKSIETHRKKQGYVPTTEQLKEIENS